MRELPSTDLERSPERARMSNGRVNDSPGVPADVASTVDDGGVEATDAAQRLKDNFGIPC